MSSFAAPAIILAGIAYMFYNANRYLPPSLLPQPPRQLAPVVYDKEPAPGLVPYINHNPMPPPVPIISAKATYLGNDRAFDDATSFKREERAQLPTAPAVVKNVKNEKRGVYKIAFGH
jgi:hypothetical protein